MFDLADRIRAASQIKPVWAVVNDMAFSAAYALASAASRVFVSRTGGVGSIGVIAMHVDQSKKDEQDGIRYTAVFAGERKNDLNPHAPISSEAVSAFKTRAPAAAWNTTKANSPPWASSSVNTGLSW